MAIADTINSMKTNITNVYNAIQAKGGTIPTNKNLENLSTAINSIEAGGGIEDVATVAALKAKVTAENIGKFYKYTGASSDGFENNALYQVVRETIGGDTPLMLGLGKVSINADKYTITYNYTNCGDDFPITNMPLGGIVTSIVYPTGDYILPDIITVSGCQHTWTLNTDRKQGTLKLYNATGNITVTITAASTAGGYGNKPKYQGLWNLFGDNNFRGEKNSVNVFDDMSFMDDFIANYVKISSDGKDRWTQFIEDLTTVGTIVKNIGKDLTDEDFDNILMRLDKVFNDVELSFKIATSSAREAIKNGCIFVTPVFDKNSYALYLWFYPKEAYAPLD